MDGPVASGGAQVVPEDELRLRHLDTIQSTVSRLAQNSFAVRGWSVTVVTLVLAVVASQPSLTPGLALLSLAPALIFWGLDAYYVRQERRFRSLYAAAARRLREGEPAPDVLPFDMDTAPWSGPATALWRVLLAPNVAAIPGMLVVTVAAFLVASR